ncbi:hypothetical protein K1719_012075 [Acacia pycnantha]|nr:hypothetical protein K1719_012075 [Acacia pycnantha]
MLLEVLLIIRGYILSKIVIDCSNLLRDTFSQSQYEIWAWSRIPAISPPIPPPSDADDHYGRRFNNVRLLRRDLKTYRIELDQMGRDDVIWEPYRDVGYEFMGADAHRQDMWRKQETGLDEGFLRVGREGRATPMASGGEDDVKLRQLGQDLESRELEREFGFS